MITLVAAILAIPLTVKHTDGDVDISFFAPMIVDLFSWYIIGVWLGVLPKVI
jgi:hypothetical protein